MTSSNGSHPTCADRARVLAAVLRGLVVRDDALHYTHRVRVGDYYCRSDQELLAALDITDARTTDAPAAAYGAKERWWAAPITPSEGATFHLVCLVP